MLSAPIDLSEIPHKVHSATVIPTEGRNLLFPFIEHYETAWQMRKQPPPRIPPPAWAGEGWWEPEGRGHPKRWGEGGL